MAYLRIVFLGVLVLGACAEEPGAVVCPSGIVCPAGTTCAAAQAVCIANACGNGLVDTALGEACDDGNILVGDGCSPSCTLESCGDGVQVAGERCDDGNTTSGDGCSADCLSIETCGNSIKDVTEVCDDGNTVSGDGCSMTCLSAEVCGNGIKDVNETCDDGNTMNGDACSANCEALAGCGNGVIDVDMNGVPVEECDDGDMMDNNDCLNICKRAVCGDGVEADLATGGFFEECDGGMTGGTTPRETAACNIDCTDKRCGDGKVNQQGGEQCDDVTTAVGTPKPDTAACDSDCTVPICGDNVTNSVANETCDPGTIGGNTSGCDANCTTPECGDGHVNTSFVPAGGTLPEACDDGGTMPGDGCSALCQIESCGNGVTETVNGEECDDGDTDDLDACRNNCQLPKCGDGIESTSETCDEGADTATCDLDCSVPSCSDGHINPAFTPAGGTAPENCDDGNLTNGDGCSALCRIESCGNGVTDAANGEECDDGDADDLDECRNNCQLPECGDGVHSASEVCDTGGNSASCNFDCSAPACGDGITNTAFTPIGGTETENCDDGGTMSGDGCNSLCRLEPFTLSVVKTGTGDGTIGSNPAGINCGTDCLEVYAANTVVTLTATPLAKSRFVGWSGGGCSGTGSCMVTMDAAKTVTASFEALRLTVTKDGDGSGTVTGTGIACGGDCTEDYNLNTVVSLTATADPTAVFTGWSGDCTGMGTCMVTMSQARNVTATFGLNTFSLTVNKSGTGTGTVASATPGIDCGSDCTESYLSGTEVTLIATPDATSTFTGWSGTPNPNCMGTGNCTVTMDQVRTVTATFTIKTFTLTVTAPSGGTITGTGINCGGGGNNDCTETFNAGTAVTLTATPDTKKAFSTWGGSCAGNTTNSCMLTMDAAKTASATFVDNKLTIVREGTGTGTVTGNVGQINCGNKCSDNYNVGVVVTLTASPAVGSRFGGWSETACGMNLTCPVTMNSPTTVTATFIDEDTVTATFAGTGSGTLSWSPSGADCTADCTRTYDDGTMVTITATAMAGSEFTGWSGDCTGLGDCTITLGDNANVTATFEVLRTLSVTVGGTGTGTVTSGDAKITCASGQTCGASYANGTVVSLMATPSSSTFAGWTGDCSTCGTATTCMITMSAARSCTATFDPP